MARSKRKSIAYPITPRTVERIAIAAIAAIATRGSGESVAVVAITIFCILVFIEELGRLWVWHGKSVTLRDVAFSTIGELRLQRAIFVERRKRERRRAASRPGRNKKALNQGHQAGRRISKRR